MKYVVKIGNLALLQLNEIVTYISGVYHSTSIASQWLSLLENAIISLEFFPYRFPIIEGEMCNTDSLDIHKMYLKNFFIYYVINENEKTVIVIAIVYTKRNQNHILKKFNA